MNNTAIIRLGTEEPIDHHTTNTIIDFCDKDVDIKFVNESYHYDISETDYLKEQMKKIGKKFPDIRFVLYYSYCGCSRYLIYQIKGDCIKIITSGGRKEPTSYKCELKVKYDFCPENEIWFE